LSLYTLPQIHDWPPPLPFLQNPKFLLRDAERMKELGHHFSASPVIRDLGSDHQVKQKEPITYKEKKVILRFSTASL